MQKVIFENCIQVSISERSIRALIIILRRKNVFEARDLTRLGHGDSRHGDLGHEELEHEEQPDKCSAGTTYHAWHRAHMSTPYVKAPCITKTPAPNDPGRVP